jgi:hypothetical protein
MKFVYNDKFLYKYSVVFITCTPNTTQKWHLHWQKYVMSQSESKLNIYTNNLCLNEMLPQPAESK